MTLIELKDLIADNCIAEDDIHMNHEGNYLDLFIYNDLNDDDQFRVRVYLTSFKQNREKVGVHTIVDDIYCDYQISCAIESAINDNFPAVYVHLNYQDGRSDLDECGHNECDHVCERKAN